VITRDILLDDITEDLNIVAITPTNTINTTRLGPKPKVYPATKADLHVTELDRHTSRSKGSVVVGPKEQAS